MKEIKHVLRTWLYCQFKPADFQSVSKQEQYRIFQTSTRRRRELFFRHMAADPRIGLFKRIHYEDKVYLFKYLPDQYMKEVFRKYDIPLQAGILKELSLKKQELLFYTVSQDTQQKLYRFMDQAAQQNFRGCLPLESHAYNLGHLLHTKDLAKNSESQINKLRASAQIEYLKTLKTEKLIKTVFG